MKEKAGATAGSGSYDCWRKIGTVSPGASRVGIVRRKLRDPILAAERHGQTCCHQKTEQQGLGVMAPDKYFVLRRAFKSAAVLGGNGLADASLGA